MTYRIELSTIEITDETLRVISLECATCFIDERHRKLPNINDVLAKLKETRKACRENGITIRRAGYKKELDEWERSGEYAALVDEYNTLWRELKDGWQTMVDKGLYAPLGDDDELKKLTRKQWRVAELFWRSSPIHIVLEINRNLDKIQESLDSDDGSTLIAVSL